MSQSKNVKKLALFKRGAAAAQKYTGSPDFYFCPICQTGFSQTALSNGELTLEHIPPASIGGKGIALTCKPCNNKAGDSIDAAMKKRSNLIQFAEIITQGKTDNSGYGSLQIGGEYVNFSVENTNGALNFKIIEKSNNPRVIERTATYLASLAQNDAWKDAKFQITSQVYYHDKLATVGDLKSAFLVAFAALGYRYAFDPRLDIVRQQILNPNDHVISMCTVGFKQPKDIGNLLLSVQSLPCIVVKLDRIGIFLPWLNSSRDFYGELPTGYKPNQKLHLKQLTLNEKPIAWPTQLDMVLDFWPPSNSESHG